MSEVPRYRVTDDNRGCEKCGCGQTFHICWLEDGGEVCSGVSWSSFEEAQYVCRLVNNAYEAGKLSCQR